MDTLALYMYVRISLGKVKDRKREITIFYTPIYLRYAGKTSLDVD